MDIQKILLKLEPLMPRQVGKWRRILDLAQSEVKELVERQVRHTAYRVLGDFRSRLLLSLPPEKRAKGPLQLGSVLYEEEKWPAGISTKELTQNLAIFGRSGAGKTNVAFHLLQQIVKRRIPFLFLDWKRTARHLLPLLGKRLQIYTPGRSISPFPFNPFIVPPGLEANVYINHVVDILGDAYTLGDGAKSMVQRALASCHDRRNSAPSVSDVLDALEEIPAKQRATGWKISAARALETLEFSGATTPDKESQRRFTGSLLKSNTVIELDALSQSTKRFLVPLLCFWIYCVQLASATREHLRFVIFLEEAHHVLYRQQQRAKESLMEMLLRQCRELGLAFVVVDQHPHLISSAATGNCFTTVCLNQKDPADMNKAAGLSLVDDSDKRHFSMLPVGQGIVKLQDRWRKPFLVQFPLVKIQKGVVTDAMLDGLLKGKVGFSALRERALETSVGDGRSRAADTALDEGAVDLLEDVLLHPGDGVDKRYKRLKLSADRGNRYKRQLIHHGFVIPERTKIGRTHRVVLRVTDEARTAFQLDNGNRTYASLVHEYWKYFYGRLYKERGYRVQLEASRKHGRTDVLATRASESVAIEVETGKSNVVWNVRQDLLEGYSRVIVVATDETAMAKIERQLGRAGLILPGRVQPILRDDRKSSSG